MRYLRSWLVSLFAVSSSSRALPGRPGADEGMWLFNNPPRSMLKEKYGFEPRTPGWRTCSGRRSVSTAAARARSSRPTGLVMTNHHVGADALQKLGTKDNDYVAHGFHARTPAEEIKCVDLELNVLMSIEDVTARVNAAVQAGLPSGRGPEARRAAMNTIEKESLDKTGLRSDVVTLYQGGLYHLYRYKKYTDVRLVFAPEEAIAFFGGDPDNFEYPRYDLDICFFRVYENGQPAEDRALPASGAPAGPATASWCSWPETRARPTGWTRWPTWNSSAIGSFPISLNLIRRREVLLRTYSERSAENARRAKDDLFSHAKLPQGPRRRAGRAAGPGRDGPQAAKRRSPARRRGQRPRLSSPPARPGTRWPTPMKVLERRSSPTTTLLEARPRPSTASCSRIARRLVRLAEETAKPNTERLREYRQSNLESLKQLLFSEAPIYADLETIKLADSLSLFMEIAGADNELVAARCSTANRRRIGRPSWSAARRLADVAVRKQLAEGGSAGDRGLATTP